MSSSSSSEDNVMEGFFISGILKFGIKMNIDFILLLNQIILPPIKLLSASFLPSQKDDITLKKYISPYC
jgi:hypothetical protein